MEQKLRIDILTLFPQMFSGPLTESVLKRAQEKKILEINITNIRDFATDIHKTVDDSPYGGGPGMVMRVDVLDHALQHIVNEGQKITKSKPHIILMTPQGETFTQTLAGTLSHNNWLVIICGHFEGYDERIRSLVNQEISIGDYVLTGGEIPALVVIDSVSRLIPGTIGKNESTHEESFSYQHSSNFKNSRILEYPHYTRPEVYKDSSVPNILLSGNHGEIAKWRQEQAIYRTRSRRPDLLDSKKF